MEAALVYFFSMVAILLGTKAKYPTIVGVNPAFDSNMDELETDKTTADGLMVDLQSKTLAGTEENLELKKELSLEFADIAQVMSASGATDGIAELKGMESYTFSVLFTTMPEELVKSLDKILGVIDDNKIALLNHGITVLIIARIKALRDSYAANKFITKEAIKEHKKKHAQLETLKAKIQNDLTTKMDKNARIFRFNNMDYYLTYVEARKVTTRHTHKKTPIPIEATTGNLELILSNKNTGERIVKCKLEVPSINFSTYTDVNGEILKELMLPGNYTGTITCEGYESIDFSFSIVKGIVTDLGFMLVPITI